MTLLLAALVLAALIAGWKSSTPTAPGLQRHLSGHLSSVNSLSWSPDSRYLASGSMDTTVRIWEVGNGRTIQTLTGFRGNLSAVAWSPDGRYLATGSNEPGDTLRIWSTTNWQVVHSVNPARDGLVKSLSWSPDSKYIAVGIRDISLTTPTLRALASVYDVAGMQLVSSLTNQSGLVDSVDWSPDGRHVAVSLSRGAGGSILIWEALAGGSSGRVKFVLEGHNGPVGSVSWSPAGEEIASGSQDMTVKIWDASTGQPIATMSDHSLQAGGSVTSVAWSPDGRRLASASWDKTVRTWEAGTWKPLDIFPHPAYVNVVAWSPDGDLLGSGDENGAVRVWK
ncbi:MAG TPA: WD40 repeat domain-containing protein [Chloroflexia bacterium]